MDKRMRKVLGRGRQRQHGHLPERSWEKKSRRYYHCARLIFQTIFHLDFLCRAYAPCDPPWLPFSSKKLQKLPFSSLRFCRFLACKVLSLSSDPEQNICRFKFRYRKLSLDCILDDCPWYFLRLNKKLCYYGFRYEIALTSLYFGPDLKEQRMLWRSGCDMCSMAQCIQEQHLPLRPDSCNFLSPDCRHTFIQHSYSTLFRGALVTQYTQYISHTPFFAYFRRKRI